MSPFDDFVARWSGTRRDFERMGVLVSGVKLLDEVLADVGELRTREQDATVRLTEAARLTGYSVDHLSRLVRQGRIPNAGRPRSPRIRVADLPARREFARTGDRCYSVDTDARRLLSRRGGRHYGEPNSQAK